MNIYLLPHLNLLSPHVANGDKVGQLCFNETEFVNDGYANRDEYFDQSRGKGSMGRSENCLDLKTNNHTITKLRLSKLKSKVL